MWNSFEIQYGWGIVVGLSAALKVEAQSIMRTIAHWTDGTQIPSLRMIGASSRSNARPDSDRYSGPPLNDAHQAMKPANQFFRSSMWNSFEIQGDWVYGCWAVGMAVMARIPRDRWPKGRCQVSPGPTARSPALTGGVVAFRRPD
jgi:hypothetical protein